MWDRTFNTRTCECCGKEFIFSIPVKQYLYKKILNKKTVFFCSDKCKRDWEANREYDIRHKRKVNCKGENDDVHE